MRSITDLSTVADAELLGRLVALLAGSRRTEADLVAHIGEVDARRVYVRDAAPSMFVYCTERLHLSEAEAWLRIAAARAARQHPQLLEMLADGRLHLSAVAKLAPHLTPENRADVLSRAAHRSKREIDELVAELAPRPDVSASVRKLPAGRLVARPVSVRIDLGAVAPDGFTRPASEGLLTPSSSRSPELRPEQVDSTGMDRTVGFAREAPANARTGDASTPQSEGAARPREAPARSSEDATPPSNPALVWAAAPTRHSSVIEPLAPARYRVQFTASAQLRDKLERLQDLMRSSVPDGDLAAVIDAAVTEKLEKMEARRFAKTRSPRKTMATTDTAARTRNVPATVKRAVHARDGDRCAYVDAGGHRCTARAHLEFHHRQPFALGGDHSPSGLSLFCRAHNRYMAEVDFGAGAIAQHRRPSNPSLVADRPPAPAEVAR